MASPSGDYGDPAARVSELIAVLLEDPGFASERNQIRSKALLSELTPEAAGHVNYTFNLRRVVANAELVLFAAEQTPATLEGDGHERLSVAVAETLEHLGSLGEGLTSDDAYYRAAVLYELTGYQANSALLARRIALPNFDTSLEVLPLHLLLRWSLLFLRRRVVALNSEVSVPPFNLEQLATEAVSRMDRDEGSFDDLMSLAEIPLIVDLFRGISSFCLQGRDDGLDRARHASSELSGVYVRAGEIQKSTILAGLSSCLEVIGPRSTWTQLTPSRLEDEPTRNRYLRLLARGPAGDPSQDRGIFELWRSQIEAIEGGLLDSGDSLVIQMPTSAGKTRIAELGILKCFIDHAEAKAVYVAPYRALADQVEHDLGSILGDLGYRVSTVLGSFESDEFQDYLLSETDLLVTTPEKLDLIYRSQPDFFKTVKLIVFDEGHLVDDHDRGAHFELLITKLRRKLANDGTRFLFLSAVMSPDNLEDFAQWFAGDPSNRLTSVWRPTRQLLGRFQWKGTNGELRYSDPGPFVPNLIYPRSYTDYTPKLHREKVVQFPDPASKGQTAAELAIKFAEQGAVLVFTTIPIWADSLARTIMDGLRLRRQTEIELPTCFRFLSDDLASVEAASDWLGAEHLVTRALREGVGLHYGPMPESVRRAIEADFRSGRLPVLVANNTLAQGVNLPVRTVIVHSTTRPEESEDSDEFVPEQIPVRDFWNICGRAGRAGVETEGQIVYLVSSLRDERLFKTYADQSNIEPIRGRLFEVLCELKASRISEESLETAIDSEILSILVEEAVQTPEVHHLEDLLNSSLVRVQADRAKESLEPLIQRSFEIAQATWEHVPDSSMRSTFAKTGLSIGSCRALMEVLESDLDNARNLLLHGSAQELLSFLLTSCKELTEMQPRYTFDGPITNILQEWVAGSPLSALLASYTDSDKDSRRLTRFIEDYFSYRLPWGFSSYTRIAYAKLGISEAQVSDDVRYLPSMVKWGVSTKEASWAMSLGCPTRSSATQFAAAFTDEPLDKPDYLSFVRWFGGLTEEDLASRFNMSHHQIRAVSPRTLSASLFDAKLRDILTDPHDVTFEVVGISYEGRLGAAVKLQIGETIELARDYGNQYDRNAIKVRHNGDDLGYVERQVARAIAPEMDSGVVFEAKITERKLSAHPPRLVIRAIGV